MGIAMVMYIMLLALVYIVYSSSFYTFASISPVSRDVKQGQRKSKELHVLVSYLQHNVPSLMIDKMCDKMN